MAKELEYIDPNDLVIVGLDTDDTKEHPLFDERINLPVSEARVRNIMTYGVQQPVTARLESGVYYVADGRQRVRAAREAAKRQSSAGALTLKVPVRLVRSDDAQLLGIMVSLNEQRENDDVLTKAKKAARMLNLVGSIDEVSIAFGLTVTQIRNYLSLVEADPRIHGAILAGKITASVGIELARYSREEQVTNLGRILRPRERNEAKTEGKPTQAKNRRAKKVQTGIRRTWLRNALQTKAAESLSEDQRKVLAWIATGESDPQDWFDTFFCEADVELNDAKAEKEERARIRAERKAEAVAKRNEQKEDPCLSES